MKNKNTYQSRKVLFKKWTRTSWGVFASLKVVVHNHCTRISSFKNTLFKQQGADHRFQFANLFNDIDTISEYEYAEVHWEEELLAVYPLYEIVPVKFMREAPMALFFQLLLYIPIDKFYNVDRDFFISEFYEREDY